MQTPVFCSTAELIALHLELIGRRGTLEQARDAGRLTQILAGLEAAPELAAQLATLGRRREDTRRT